MQFRTENRFAVFLELLQSMSPESGNRFRDKDMRKNQRPKAHGANPKDRDVL